MKQNKQAQKEAFRFYRSYYEVALELPEGEREAYLMAILNRHFEGEEPELKGMAKLAYVGQRHSIERQCKGYEDRQLADTPKQGPPAGPSGGPPGGGPQGPSAGPPAEGRRKKEEGERKKEKGVNLEGRKKEFAQELSKYVEEYGKKTVREFYDYWTETSARGRKMRYEKEKTWETGKRLARWKSNEKEFSKTSNNPKTKEQDYDRLD